MHADLVDLLRVHDDARFSELERLRTEPDRVSSPGLVEALDRTSLIAGIGAGKVEVDDVPPAKLEALARYGMRAKTPSRVDSTPDRQAATLLATVRHLETASVDDALDVLEVLITSKLLNRAVREGNESFVGALDDEFADEHLLGGGGGGRRAPRALGRDPRASVVLRDGAAATQQDLIAFARDNMAHFKAPTQVESVAQLPKTATGKIQKYVLRRGASAASRQ